MSEASTSSSPPRIPRDKGERLQQEEARTTRLKFATVQTGALLDHVGRYSIDPSVLPGNVENFFGVAQVSMGACRPPARERRTRTRPFLRSPCERDLRWRLDVEPTKSLAAIAHSNPPVAAEVIRECASTPKCPRSTSVDARRGCGNDEGAKGRPPRPTHIRANRIEEPLEGTNMQPPACKQGIASTGRRGLQGRVLENRLASHTLAAHRLYGRLSGPYQHRVCTAADEADVAVRRTRSTASVRASSSSDISCLKCLATFSWRRSARVRRCCALWCSGAWPACAMMSVSTPLPILRDAVPARRL